MATKSKRGEREGRETRATLRDAATRRHEKMKDDPTYAAAYAARPDGPFSATRCKCGHPSCANWHVSPAADIQGVGFTEDQAKAVADFLNARGDKYKEDRTKPSCKDCNASGLCTGRCKLTREPPFEYAISKVGHRAVFTLGRDGNGCERDVVCSIDSRDGRIVLNVRGRFHMVVVRPIDGNDVAIDLEQP